MKGATALITSLNIAYDEEETRSFVRLNLIALAITAGAVLIAIVAIIAIAAMGSLGHTVPFRPCHRSHGRENRFLRGHGRYGSRSSGNPVPLRA